MSKAIGKEFKTLKAYQELKEFLGEHGVKSLDFCLQQTELFGGMNAYEFVNTLTDIHDIDREDAWREVLGVAQKIYG